MTEKTPYPEGHDEALDGAMAVIWLYSKDQRDNEWRYFTSVMAPAEREAASAAVERFDEARMRRGGAAATGIRWWRDEPGWERRVWLRDLGMVVSDDRETPQAQRDEPGNETGE